MQIGRKDVFWNYAATFFQIGAGVILLPFILRVFPRETVAIWTIFSTITSLNSMFDFGFNPSFARNVSYVVSGVKELKKTGFQIVENSNNEIDYGLFKGVIDAMRWFYGRIALILFVFLITVGTYYINTILKSYPYSHLEVYLSYAVLCIINSYSLYTLYYDSLMQGQGFVKKAKQIQMTGQVIYLLIASILILLKVNLIAIVSAQALSIIVRRTLSYKTIFTTEFKYQLQNAIAKSRKDILKIIYPNATKLGLNGIAAFLTLRSSLFIGSLYISLNMIASYGITMQIIGIISSIASVYFNTYLPKISQQRIQNDIAGIKNHYLKACLFAFLTYLTIGLSFVLLGDWALKLIKSQTHLLPKYLIVIALFVSFYENFVSLNSFIVLSKNKVSFFKISLIVGVLTLILLFVFFRFISVGVLGMIIIPCIAECLHWVWISETIKELKIKYNDVYHSCVQIKNVYLWSISKIIH